jgi:hypothetical protein
MIESARIEGGSLLVRVAPGEGGEYEIGIEFVDARPGAAAATPELLVRLTMTGMEMGTQQIQAASADGLRYTVRGSFMTMQGPWRMEIILRRPGFDDIRQTFNLNIQDSSAPLDSGGHEHD